MEAWLRDTIKALAAHPPEADLDYNVTDAERYLLEGIKKGATRPPVMLLLAAEYLFSFILDPANGVLDFAFTLIGFTFGLHLGIASDVTDAFLQLATHVLGRAFNAVFVSHDRLLLY
jgi:hypothetical protein